MQLAPYRGARRARGCQWRAGSKGARVSDMTDHSKPEEGRKQREREKRERKREREREREREKERERERRRVSRHGIYMTDGASAAI